jgi:hypothetical protein
MMQISFKFTRGFSPMHLNCGMLRFLIALAIGLSIATPGVAAEKFRKLKDGEIKAKLAGMETTDGVHWAEQYMRDGSFKAFDMGKPITGKWYVRNGELCLQDAKKKEPECKEVWASGTKIEFRSPSSGMPAIEGMLQKQQARK